ncbi:hypothetical protein HMPREF1869_00953 [Bacteroidales bacterium KA00251]|nr:hypothetical protein HMPREF1869_00953 [Bacteroidales bacterium KA00251]
MFYRIKVSYLTIGTTLFYSIIDYLKDISFLNLLEASFLYPPPRESFQKGGEIEKGRL